MAKARRRPQVRSKMQRKSAVSPVMIGAVTVAAILVVAGLIILGNQGPNISGSVDASRFPTLGDALAPVTMVEFSDYG